MFHCNMEYLLIWDTLLVSVAPLSNLPCWIFYTLSRELKQWAEDKVCSAWIQGHEMFTLNLCVHMIRKELIYIGTTSFSLGCCCVTISGSISVTVLQRKACYFVDGAWRPCVFLVAGRCFFFFWSSSRWLCCSGVALADYRKLTCSWSPADLNIEKVI